MASPGISTLWAGPLTVHFLSKEFPHVLSSETCPKDAQIHRGEGGLLSHGSDWIFSSPFPTSLALLVSPHQIQCLWRDSLQFLLKPGGCSDFPKPERGNITRLIHSSHVFSCGGPCLHTLSEISEPPTPEPLWDSVL